MIFKIKHKPKGFFQCANQVIEDRRISFKAKGVLCYLLSKPSSWVPRVGEISTLGPDGKESIQSALQELKAAGYARLENEVGDGGRLIGKCWCIFEDSNDSTDDGLSPTTGKPPQGEKPSEGKPATSNTDKKVTRTGFSNTEAQTLIDAEKARLPDGLHEAWDEWQAYVKQRKLKRTPLTAKKLVDMLLKMTTEEAIAAIDNSIAGSYQSIYERNGHQTNGKHFSQNGSGRPTPADIRNSKIIGAEDTRAAIRREEANPEPAPWDVPQVPNLPAKGVRTG